MSGILKKAILNNENEGDSGKHDKTETFLKCLSINIVMLVIIILLFILVKLFVKDCVKPDIALPSLKNTSIKRGVNCWGRWKFGEKSLIGRVTINCNWQDFSSKSEIYPPPQLGGESAKNINRLDFCNDQKSVQRTKQYSIIFYCWFLRWFFIYPHTDSVICSWFIANI